MHAAPITNKAAGRAIISLDLAELWPKQDEMCCIDLKDYLFKGLILREADFRAQVAATDWRFYSAKYVAIHSSTDAVIPMWAYMVLAAELAPFAKDVVCAPPQHAEEVLLYRAIDRLDCSEYEGQRVVVKGCGDRPVDAAAFVYISRRLAPMVRALSFGEPCSMVPVYKRPL